MVSGLLKHDARWLTPAPLWRGIGDLADNDTRKKFNRPTILRFKNDSFMDELLALLSYYPEKLREWEAVPETWREPMREPSILRKLSVPEPISFFNTRQKRAIEKRNPLPLNTDNDEEDGLLKLYQPSQQRFYLVSASLVCRTAGLPDRTVSREKQEQSAFVIRRIVPDDDVVTFRQSGRLEVSKGAIQGAREYAYVSTETGYQWREIGSDNVLQSNHLVENEERLPMFTVGYEQLDGYKRKLMSGLLPVGKREAYVSAGSYVEATDEQDQSAVLSEKRAAFESLLKQQVGAPWSSLLTQANNATIAFTPDPELTPSGIEDDFGGAPSGGNDDSVRTSREQVQTMSWYVILDLADFLNRYLNEVWVAIRDTNPAALGTNTPQRDVYDLLLTVHVEESLLGGLVGSTYIEDKATSLIDALQRVINDPQLGVGLEAVESQYVSNIDLLDPVAVAAAVESGWPDFIFPLADITSPGAVLIDSAGVFIDLDASQTVGLEPYEIQHLKVDRLCDMIIDAIAINEDLRAPETPVRPPNDKLDQRDAFFVVRCVYETPNCGPFRELLLSDPTRPFELASFFDPDAPGRPIRIPMPLDITPAGLRKYSRNATFMISDSLCGKIKGIRKITLGDLVLSVLPWPFHKDLPNISKQGPCKDGDNPIGMFCSLSIPIVTLCAMILLIIMVALFDLFFRWLPLLFVCLPIPGLKGKNK